ncbi:M48 family metallopeptidase [Euhalothece natronophila Z-M001]|uniref:M48 family metallopeptidase n=1 Tax=Euhalothece natronophila Z-M001 TaxID=522448 RepID=A0A5B8NJ88_9CHRO|nr:M48 family metallopeptidase [Euhalothece natronophila]QDZ39044.1 M48 family metallopeptidase [Euhalothece natronophila Z-M001]
MVSESKANFKKKVWEWAEKLEVSVEFITLRSMRNKWASCSSTGRLTFDSSLLELPPHLQDYAIVHELLHLQIPNHGRLWQCLMEAHLGDYQSYEKELKEIVRDRMKSKN